MIPTNLEAQTRSAHLEKLHGLVAFFEQQIGKSLEEKDFRLARSWHASLTGAYMLAKRLGLEEPDHRGREDMWSERIRTATMGLRRFLFENVYQNPVAKGEETKAIGMMIFCSALTIWYFKYKKWL